MTTFNGGLSLKQIKINNIHHSLDSQYFPTKYASFGWPLQVYSQHVISAVHLNDVLLTTLISAQYIGNDQYNLFTQIMCICVDKWTNINALLTIIIRCNGAIS